MACVPAPAKLKVFISVDMEGISGLVSGEETSRTGRDYGLFRQLMTEEAIAGYFGVPVALVTGDLATKASMIPGARRTGNRSAAFTHQDLLEVMKFYLIATA
jgi:hypothetical protein